MESPARSTDRPAWTVSGPLIVGARRRGDCDRFGSALSIYFFSLRREPELPGLQRYVDRLAAVEALGGHRFCGRKG